MNAPPPAAVPLSRRYLAALLLVLAVAAGVRVWNLGDLPAGLFCDEAALGYDSWAILHHGIDENGVTLPLFVWSFGGYKNPVFIYSAMLPIGILGLSELSVRLTSALFGLATVLVLFVLGREVRSPRFGLLAAGLLAVQPWHVHFSRIAFEVISFPFLVSLGALLLVRFRKGRRTLAAAALCFGLCGYAYAIAKLFVPGLLACAVLLLLPELRARRREAAGALAVLLVTVAPLVAFDLRHREEGSRYFRSTSILRGGQPVAKTAQRFLSNYASFFSPTFLFRAGDPIVRHAVPGHGELEPYWAPLLVLGLAAVPLARRREAWLLFAWLALFPAGASLMNEIPSASRGLIGSAAFALLAAAGAELFLEAVGRLGRPALGSALRAAAVAALVATAAFSLATYMVRYAVEYPIDSARGIYGFQFGYRDVVAAMEPLRSRYSRLMLTTTGGNQTQIFAQFYDRVDPHRVAAAQDIGYLVLEPGEYSKYSLASPVLYAVRAEDLQFFSDYSVKRQVLGPGGTLEFKIVEVRARKEFVSEWEVLGPFGAPASGAAGPEQVRPDAPANAGYRGVADTVYWTPARTRFCRLNLNALLAGSAGSAPENACGWAVTQVDAPAARTAELELHGADSETLVWLNGELISPLPLHLLQGPAYRPVALRAGRNPLAIRSCKSTGDWFVMVRFASPDGKNLDDLRYAAEIPPSAPAEPLRPQVGDVATASGFDALVDAPHRGPYADYRGSSDSAWVYSGEAPAALVWRTAPAPRRAPTLFTFTGSMGETAGSAELWVDGRFCVAFDLGAKLESRVWHGAGCTLLFQAKRLVAGNSGVFALLLGADTVAPGKAVELAVRSLRTSGDNASWFMVKPYRDTADVEHLTPEVFREAESPTWQTGRR